MEIQEKFYKNYHAPWFSQPNIFCLVVFYLVFALPFYVSFTTQNFWLKPISQQMGVQYTYTGNHIINVQYSLNTNTFVNQKLTNIPQLFYLSQNSNNLLYGFTFNIISGQNSEFAFTLNNPNNITLLKTEIIAFYQVNIPALKQKYNTALIMSIDTPSSVSSVNLMGKIYFQNSHPLSAISNNGNNLNLPEYLNNFQYILDYDEIKKNIYKNNFKLKFVSNTLITYSSLPPTNYNFNIMVYPKITSKITYFPSFLQTLKNAFSQYMSVFIVTYIIGKIFLSMVASNSVFDLEVETSQIQYMKK